ncbi:hypothetical protein DWX78_15840 [Dorea formicigenerans]|uniref:Uncharacterized protein n=1 Tax=Dorea formicigenerans TaxID=39486 RepID=A0A412K8N0_9FIRM|nr:hypothetical protein DWX78_15840 [Dorea formicigenerans]
MSVHLIKCCTAKPDKSMKESNPKTTQNYELQTRKSRNARAENIKIYQLQKKNYVHFFAHFTKKNFWPEMREQKILKYINFKRRIMFIFLLILRKKIFGYL